MHVHVRREGGMCEEGGCMCEEGGCMCEEGGWHV